MDEIQVVDTQRFKLMLGSIPDMVVVPKFQPTPIICKMEEKSTAVNLTVDLICKSVANRLSKNPLGLEVIVYNNNRVLHIARSPWSYLTFQTSVDVVDDVMPDRQFGSPRDPNRSKTSWIKEIDENIIQPIIQGDQGKIDLDFIRFMLTDLFKCREGSPSAPRDLQRFLQNTDFKLLQSQIAVIAPSIEIDYGTSGYYFNQADLVLDSSLVDIKNSSKLKFRQDVLLQQLFYYFAFQLEPFQLAGRNNPLSKRYRYNPFTNIDSFSLFFPRYNRLEKVPVLSLFKKEEQLRKAKNIFWKNLRGLTPTKLAAVG